MKGIFYPYKNSIHSLEVRTHQVFLDSSYINKVFDSFEFTFEPEEEQELFRNKLLETTKYIVDNKISKYNYNKMKFFENNLNNNVDLNTLEKSIEYILNSDDERAELLEKLFFEYSQITDTIKTLNYHLSNYKSFGEKHKVYNFLQLSEISKIKKKEAVDFVLEELNNLSNGIDYNFATGSLNLNPVSQSELYYAKLTFENLGMNYLMVLENYKKLLPVVQNRYYGLLIFNLFPLSLDIHLRHSKNFPYLESSFVDLYKDIYHNFIENKSDDIIRFRLGIELTDKLISFCSKESSLIYIKDTVLTLPIINEQCITKFYALNWKFDKNKIEELLEKPKNRYFIYSIFKESGNIGNIPIKYLNYESIAESQLIDFFCRRENGFKDFKLDFIIKSDVSESDDKKYYNIYQVSFKANVFDDETKKFVKDKYIEMSILAGPYSEKINIEKLDIPDKKITLIKGFCKKSDFEKLIKVHTGELIDNTNEIYTVEDMDDTLLFD